MEDWFPLAVEAIGKQLGPGGFALLLICVFLAWRWVVRDRDDREDRIQMGKEADARSEAMLRLASALENINRNDEVIRTGLSDSRNILERIETKLEMLAQRGRR